MNSNLIRTALTVAVGIAAILVCTINAEAQSAPPLKVFSSITADATGQLLQNSMIWTDPPLTAKGSAVAFRRTFELERTPASASLLLFADARYILWVDGSYVERGPSRFQPNGPQYDCIDLTTRLHTGRNSIVLLVVGNLSGGKVMLHRPGLTALLTADGREILRTDASWKWSDNTRYRSITASWANLCDNIVDARMDDGDWISINYPDNAWKPAVKISGDDWGPLTRTLIPPLRETPVTFDFKANVHLPVILKPGERLEFDCGHLVQAYLSVELDAESGSELKFEPFGVKYIARAGHQRHFTIDTQGIASGAIIMKSGSATITNVKLIERLYPFDCVGSFKSNDEVLNRLWKMCARSCQVLSEDSYVDCADRERVEWMDNTPPGYDITRTAMVSPGPDGTPLYGDARLLGNLIRRTALTLQPEGWVKAHTCSDRYDIHAKMEDRACDWIEGERLYYEATNDIAILRETWPAIVSQMDYFLARRTPRGLVNGREWAVWGNPTGYVIGEGTTLNCFVQRALVDASYLGRLVGDDKAALRFDAAANDLANAINTVLWDESTGSYSAGYFDDSEIAATLATKRQFKLPLTNHLASSTFHANVFALDRGVVPPARRSRVTTAMLAQQAGYTNSAIMVYYYSIKQMYALDQPELDKQVLDLFRTKWAAMVDSPLQCSWEFFNGGSRAHIYGMYPGYFLSSYVLGVRRDAPVAEKLLVIEPHLGNLISAEGVVVTEFGPVPISWKRDDKVLEFSFEIPAGVHAALKLPREAGKQTVTLDGHTIRIPQKAERSAISVVGGKHRGSF
jgi:alpha-L-rhamnosidase